MELQFENNVPNTTHEQSSESREGAMVRAEILKTLNADIEGLSMPENAEIIDHVVVEQGASSSLVEEIKVFSEKLASQDIQIVEQAIAEDILRKSEAYLIPFVNRIKTHGYEDRYVKAVREGFSSLRDYIELLNAYIEFEKAELGDRHGFLKNYFAGKIGEKEIDDTIDRLVAEKKYIDMCRRIIKKEETIH